MTPLNSELDKKAFDSSIPKELPPFKTFAKNIELLLELDLSKFSPYEVEQIYSQYCGFVPYHITVADINQFTSNRVFRARRNINRSLEDLSSRLTFSYPSGNFCNANGRANLKGKSVFYCSETAITAIRECKPQPRDTIYLGYWRIECLNDIKLVYFSDDSVSNKNMFYEYSSLVANELRTKSFEYSSKFNHHIDLAYKLVCHFFSNESFPYPISSWAADKILYQIGGVDILIFPSILNETLFNSWAIHPDFTDNYLVLEKVVEIELDAYNSDNFQFSIGKVGKANLFEIEWHEPNDDEQMEILKTLSLGNY